MSHRELDRADGLRRLLATLDADIEAAKRADPVPLALVRALKMERDKTVAALAIEDRERQ